MTKYIITNGTITLYHNGNVVTISTANARYKDIRALILNGEYDNAVSLINLKEGLTKKIADTDIKLVYGVLYYKGKKLNNYVARKIISLIERNRKADLLVAFLHKLMKNPSERVQDELLQFLEVGMLPLCTDGDFLAYKKVKDDYMDIHSGTLYYTPGNVVEMKRSKCDDDSSRTCSTGLHFCSYDYLSEYGSGSGDKIIVVKINPKDVVSIPKDYNDTKGRACKITVICDYEEDTNINRLKEMTFVNVHKKQKR